jgi:hypothetical protein
MEFPDLNWIALPEGGILLKLFDKTRSMLTPIEQELESEKIKHEFQISKIFLLDRVFTSKEDHRICIKYWSTVSRALDVDIEMDLKFRAVTEAGRDNVRTWWGHFSNGSGEANFTEIKSNINKHKYSW